MTHFISVLLVDYHSCLTFTAFLTLHAQTATFQLNALYPFQIVPSQYGYFLDIPYEF